MTVVKICGITSVRDAEVAVEAGADMLGLNFVAGRSRAIQYDIAAEISLEFGEALHIVAVFASSPNDEVNVVLERIQPATLQFHGSESAEFCRQFDCDYVKVFDMNVDASYDSRSDAYGDAYAHILDSGSGGTGKTFDWSKWPRYASVPLMLAGGLNPQNVHRAVTTIQPWGVDVCTGVEASVKGVKDATLIREFIAEVRRAEVE